MSSIACRWDCHACLGNRNTTSIGAWPNSLDRILPRYEYRKVASSILVYYSILDFMGQRSQYISIKFLLHKQFQKFATSRDSLLVATLRYLLCYKKERKKRRKNLSFIAHRMGLKVFSVLFLKHTFHLHVYKIIYWYLNVLLNCHFRNCFIFL